MKIFDRLSRQIGARPRLWEASLLLLYAIVCWMTLPDIPASWDELGNRNHGEIGLQLARDYLASGEPAEPKFLHEHGTAFEMLLIGIEKVLGGDFETDPAGALWIRHVSIYTIFCCAVFVFYLSVADLFSSRLAGLLAAILLALHPRIFHHAFHNSSDIGFMSLCILWFSTFRRLCKKPTVFSAFLHAIACALAIDTRVVGVFFLGVTVFVLAVNIRFKRGSHRDYERRATLATYTLLGFSTIFIVLFWPFLWGRPVGNFLWALSQFSAFMVPFEIRYMGQLFMSTDVPWHYNFVWFSITTPWYITAGVAVGALTVLRQLRAHRKIVFSKEGAGLAVGLWILVPMTVPIVLGSTLFNGWRHHYFVYPAIVIASTYGLLTTLKGVRRLVGLRFSETTLRLALALCVVLHLSLVLWTLHPYQNIYFSAPLSQAFGPQRGSEHEFEVDYWCTSYRQGLSYLATSIEGPIRVHGHWKPLWLNWLWLPPGDRERIQIVRDIQEADFHLGVFRQTEKSGYPFDFGEEVYKVTVNGIQILSVRQMRNPPFGRGPMDSALPEAPRDLRGLIKRKWG